MISAKDILSNKLKEIVVLSTYALLYAPACQQQRKTYGAVTTMQIEDLRSDDNKRASSASFAARMTSADENQSLSIMTLHPLTTTSGPTGTVTNITPLRTAVQYTTLKREVQWQLYRKMCSGVSYPGFSRLLILCMASRSPAGLRGSPYLPRPNKA